MNKIIFYILIVGVVASKVSKLFNSKTAQLRLDPLCLLKVISTLPYRLPKEGHYLYQYNPAK